MGHAHDGARIRHLTSGRHHSTRGKDPADVTTRGTLLLSRSRSGGVKQYWKGVTTQAPTVVLYWHLTKRLEIIQKLFSDRSDINSVHTRGACEQLRSPKSVDICFLLLDWPLTRSTTLFFFSFLFFFFFFYLLHFPAQFSSKDKSTHWAVDWVSVRERDSLAPCRPVAEKFTISSGGVAFLPPLFFIFIIFIFSIFSRWNLHIWGNRGEFMCKHAMVRCLLM